MEETKKCNCISEIEAKVLENAQLKFYIHVLIVYRLSIFLKVYCVYFLKPFYLVHFH